MKEEWFQFEEYKIDKFVTVADQLNALSDTHEIVEVHYSTYSSSDWAVMSGGQATALVRARKKEVPK